MQLEQTKLEEVIQAAFDAATVQGGRLARRWQTASAKAKQQLESNPFLRFDGDALLILSDSNEIYLADGQPCWHRAAARIVARYNERSH